jgi:DNA helicase-2/ATP-dependent DNA helicase PcrA
MIWGRIYTQQPSRFLRDLPREEIEIDDRYSLPYSFDQVFQGDDDGPQKWRRGTRVYHDEYGTGVVWKTEQKGPELLVIVRFETGHTARFIPKYSPLEVIADEW